MSEYFTRADAFAPAKLTEETVEVPGLGKCRVRELTCAARDKLEQAQFRHVREKRDPERYWRAGVIAASVVGGDGELVFRESDLDSLAEAPSSRWEDVYRAALRLSGMGGKVEADAGKNSESGQPA